MMSPVTRVLCAAVVILAAESVAHADAPSSENVLTRPHTVAEVEGGAIILPNAPISNAQRGGNLPFQIGKGDATIMTGLHVLFRGGPQWAIGAGALFAPHPTSDTGYGLGGATNLPRTHSRSYLYIGAEGRYFPVHTRYFDVWGGVTAGGIIIADRFDNNAATPVPSILGVPQVTVSTEGYALGAQIGGNWIATEHLVIGLTLRADIWFLPSTPSCSSFNDCATLTGKVDAFEMGLTIGYRIAL
jgi:hypothetical protein